ncbi:MAG: hypothetical protein AMXMBFR53_21650 [Gemmatimonadota bacterium]
MNGRPPRLPTWLLSRLLPRDRRGRSILGDLLEEWHGRPRGISRTVWYAVESLRLATRYLLVPSHLPGARSAGRRGGRPGRSGILDRLADDARHALRGLRHQPTFAATAVAVLAVGIGVATTVFASFQAVMVRELPVVEPDALVHPSLRTRTGEEVTLSPEEIAALSRESRTLQAAAGWAAFGAEAFPLAEDGRSLVLAMSSVTSDFFQVLGARPVLGRLLRPGDDEEGADPVAVITHEAWQRDFGGDPAVVGRRLTQSQAGRTYRIVGVAPAGLAVPVGVGYWVPTGPPGRRAWGGASMAVVARLAPASSPEAARAEFLSVGRALLARRARPATAEVASVRSLSDVVLGDVRPMLLAVTLAVGFLLLIACVNVGNLLLIRTTQREREIMVRRALGASAGAVARLFVLESALLGTAGGGLGFGLAMWLTRVLPGVAPDRLPRSEMIGLGGPPVAMATCVTLAAILVFGVAPPLVAARGNVASGLRVDVRAGTRTRVRRRVRRSLVAVQVSLAVVLLFGGGLVVRSLLRLQELDLGYVEDEVGIVEISLHRRGRGPEEVFSLLADVLDRMRRAPGVTAATWVMSRPFMGAKGILTIRPMLEGQTEEEAASNPRFPVEVGGGEIFQALGIPLVRGRGLLDTDREDAPRVAVVSEAVAQRLWPGVDPIGQRVRMTTSRPSWWTVVGVAGDTRFRALREPTPTIYVHYRQMQILPAVWTVAVRTNGDLEGALPTLREVVRDSGDGEVDVWRAVALRAYLDGGPLAEPRMSAVILAGFGVAALLLAALGLYGVMALAVRERTHELGVRRALGASAWRLRRDVLAEAVGVTLAGTAVGLSIALLLSRLLTPLLFEVRPWDPATGVAVCAALLGVALLAAYVPARRATGVDPTRALRAE